MCGITEMNIIRNERIRVTINQKFIPHIHNQVQHIRAVANGPVGPALAGPIIEPKIEFFCKNQKNKFLLFI